MTKYIGRLFNIGLCKETTRGVIALSAVSTYYVPAMGRTWDEEVDTVVDESNQSVIEDSIDQHITARRARGSFEAICRDQSLGLVLLATMGKESTLATVAGETAVKDHGFVVLESAQHQSLSVIVQDPNDTNGKGYPLAMIDSFELDFEIGKFCTYKVAIASQIHTTMGTITPVSYTTENVFLPQNANLYYASNYVGLPAAATIANVKKGSFMFKKNLEEDLVIGTLDPADRLNKQFSCEVTLEITYNDRTQIDTYLIADAKTAMRLKLVNTSVTIGNSSNPTITIDLANCKLQTVARKLDNNGLVTQTIKAKAFFSTADALMAYVTLRNTVTSVY